MSVAPIERPNVVEIAPSIFFVPSLTCEPGQVFDLEQYRDHAPGDFLPYQVGMVAAGATQLNPALYLKARQLRARVYIDEKGYLPPSARNADGGESDPHDSRSFHYVVSHLVGDPEETAEVLGNSRVALKRDHYDKLPVERLFSIPAAPTGSVESSRFIARHPDRHKQEMIALALIRAMTFHALRENSPQLYAVAEAPLLRYFTGLGVPFEPLAMPKYIEKYQSVNMPLVVDPKDILPGIRERDEKRAVQKAPFFDRAAATHGLGRFTEDL